MNTVATRHGRVVDGRGEPVADALVTIESGTAPTPEITLITDEAGNFRLGLPDGRFRIRATAPGGETGTAETDGGPADEPILVRVGHQHNRASDRA